MIDLKKQRQFRNDVESYQFELSFNPPFALRFVLNLFPVICRHHPRLSRRLMGMPETCPFFDSHKDHSRIESSPLKIYSINYLVEKPCEQMKQPIKE